MKQSAYINDAFTEWRIPQAFCLVVFFLTTQSTMEIISFRKMPIKSKFWDNLRYLNLTKQLLRSIFNKTGKYLYTKRGLKATKIIFSALWFSGHLEKVINFIKYSDSWENIRFRSISFMYIYLIKNDLFALAWPLSKPTVNDVRWGDEYNNDIYDKNKP